MKAGNRQTKKTAFNTEAGRVTIDQEHKPSRLFSAARTPRNLNLTFTGKSFTQLVALTAVRPSKQQNGVSSTIMLDLFTHMAESHFNKHHRRSPKKSQTPGP